MSPHRVGDSLLVEVGVPATAWETLSSTVAGRYVQFRDMHGEHIPELDTKLHMRGFAKGSVFYYFYVPLPADKRLLKQCLLEIADHEGIDLTTPV